MGGVCGRKKYGLQYGITDYQITGLAPLLAVLVMTLQLVGNTQKAGVF